MCKVLANTGRTAVNQIQSLPNLMNLYSSRNTSYNNNNNEYIIIMNNTVHQLWL